MPKFTKLTNLITYSFAAVRRRGVLFLWTYFVESILFDWVHGTNTSIRVPKIDQVIGASTSERDDGLLYVASFTSVVKKSVATAKQLLGEQIYVSSQFVDLGCGKGKTLLQFALHERSGNANTAVGIEYDGDLATIAKRNIKKCNLSKNEVRIHTASAVDVCDFIDSNYLLFYLYNSFQGETLKAFLSAVAHLPHCLIYVDPVERAMLTNEFDYAITNDVSGKYHANTWLLATSPEIRNHLP